MTQFFFSRKPFRQYITLSEVSSLKEVCNIVKIVCQYCNFIQIEQWTSVGVWPIAAYHLPSFSQSQLPQGSLLFPSYSSRVKARTKGQSSTKFYHDSLSLRLINTLNPLSAELELFMMEREQGHLSYISVRNSAVRGFNPNHINVFKKALQNWTNRN